MRWLGCLFQFIFFTLQYQLASSSSSSSITSSSPANHLYSPDQCFALLQFKHMFTTNGSASSVCENFGQLSYRKTMSWNETTTDCCSWDGIRCDGLTGQVIELDLSCSQLYGAILPNSSLFSLRHLQRLNLAFNDFTQSGISPSFGQFSSLTHLNLSFCFFGPIPLEISHLSNLVSLDLSSYDQLIRIEPFNFDVLLQNLTQIQILLFAHVNISSVVPTSLMNLSSLTYLDLDQTGLQGKLPDNIFHLPKLEQLNLAFNPNLTGYLPKVNWTSSGSLSALDLSGIAFSGELPDSIGHLKSLKYLNLAYCNLSGSIPMSLGKLVQMNILVLSGNNFEGRIPNSFANFTQLIILDLSKNNFSGQVSSIFSNLEQLSHLIISSNHFEGQIPNIANLSKIVIFLMQRNHFRGQFPCWVANLTQLHGFSLGRNELTGPIPFTFCGNLQVKFLEIIDLSHNNFSGVIPQCLANFSSVVSVLDLRMNNFHGSILTSFVEGNKLRNIDLNGNQLEGPVPQSLATCRHLQFLDFGNNNINDTFPYWLETLPELQVLILHSNKFHGPVGSSKTQLPFPKLRIFDLSHNEFSGLLPITYFKHFKAIRIVNEKARIGYMGESSMGESYYYDSVTLMLKGLEIELQGILTVFTTIDLSHNKFRGEIPNVIGKLRGLRLLNLSYNDLVGNIPSSLGNLYLLESLDLSSNQLSGKIPSQLTSLTFLEVVNFSQNHLEGRIPQGKQFQTFESSSYDGNLALCGFPLSNECGDNKTPQLHPTPMLHNEDDPTFASGFNWKIVGMGYGCGMVLGLVIGYLMFLTGKPKWFVRIAEGEWYKKAKRSQKSSKGHGGRKK